MNLDKPSHFLDWILPKDDRNAKQNKEKKAKARRLAQLWASSSVSINNLNFNETYQRKLTLIPKLLKRKAYMFDTPQSIT